MARTKQTARISGNSLYVPPPPPPPKLTKAQKAAQEKEIAAIKAMDPLKLKEKLDKEHVTLMEKLKKDMESKMTQMDMEFRVKLAESEFSFANQFQSLSSHLVQVTTPSPCLSSSTPITADSNSPSPVPLLLNSQTDSEAAAPSSASSTTSSSSSSPALSRVATEASEWSQIDYRTIPFPSDWPVDQTQPVMIETLEKDSADFIRFEKMLRQNGLPQSNLLVVQRIYNRPLWARYYLARKRVMEKAGNEELNNPQSMGNEKILFHGTRNTPPHLLYATADGFDVRMAGHGMLGAGCYFSSSSEYSGRSYAHPLGQGNPAAIIPAQMTLSTPPKTRKNSTKPVGPTLVADKLPANAAQMLIARVCCGTEFNHKKQSYNSERRPPTRPFQCKCCNKTLNLENMHLELIKQDFMEKEEMKLKKALQPAQLEVVEEEKEEAAEEEEEEQEAETKSSTSRKRRRTTNVWSTKKKRKATPKAAAAVSTSAASSSSSADGSASSSSSVPSTPLKLVKPWIAAALAQISTPSPQKPAAAQAPFQPPAAVAAAIAAATNSFSTFLASFPNLNTDVVMKTEASTPAPVAVSDAAVPMDEDSTEVAAPPSPSAASVASAPVLPVAAAVAAAFSASSVAASEPAPSTSVVPGEQMVHCPHCTVELGTRNALLAHPYRYDSVVMDHMSSVNKAQIRKRLNTQRENE